jgi:hypothetical protein
MDAPMDIYFWSEGNTSQSHVPSVSKIIEYFSDGTEGHLYFDGCYRINSEDANNTSLPQTCQMTVIDNINRKYTCAIVEIYRRDLGRNTDTTFEDDDGSHICLFPTDEQTIYFHILCMEEKAFGST